MVSPQVPHPAVQRGQPDGVRSAVSRHQHVRQSPAAAEDQRLLQPLELAAGSAGLVLDLDLDLGHEDFVYDEEVLFLLLLF